MKKRFMSILAVATVLAACESKEDPVVPEITAPLTEYQIPVSGTEEEDVFIEFTTNVDWTATFKESVDWASFSPQSGVAGDGKIKLIVDPTESKDNRNAVLVVTAGKGASAIQQEFSIVQAFVEAFSLVASSAEIDAKGGNVDIKAMTNVPYEVSIPSDVDWVKVVASKAYGEKATTLTVSEFGELDSSREAVITVTPAGFEAVTFTLKQNGPQTKIWGIDMSTVLSHTATYSKTFNTWNEEKGDYSNVETETINTVVSLALYDGNLVVCAGDGSKPVILDKKTGEKKGELNTGDIIPMTITNDEAGNLVFCNRVWNWWISNYDFSVWYMKPGDKIPTLLVSTKEQGYEFGPSYIGYSLSVRGDVTKNAAIAAPWEGPNGGGENMILAWNVKDGKAEQYVKQTLTGFVGLNSWYGADGYWSGAPNNSPAYALLGSDLSNGSLMGLYDENVLYVVDAAGACTKLYEDKVVSGNCALNTMEVRTIGGKDYLAISADTFFDYANPTIILADINTKEVLYTKTSKLYTEELIGNASGDVTIEAADGGVNLYYMASNASAIEAYWFPIK